MKREEKEVREFLVDMKPLLKRANKYSVNNFLSEYVRLNPVSMTDGLKLVCGDLTLREEAFQRLCRSQLLLPDIKQHCLPKLYPAIRYIREIKVRHHDIGE